MVGLSRFELLTPRLSSVCSNQLSYRPSFSLEPYARSNPILKPLYCQRTGRTPGPIPSKLDRRAKPQTILERVRSIFEIPLRDSRKEVIQPQVLLQLPCYDFTPITDHTLGTCLPCGLAQLLLVQPAFVM